MKKFLIAVIVVLLLLAGGFLWFLNWTKEYLHSDSFIHELEGYMSEVMAVPVEIEGIKLIDVSSASMVGFKIPLYEPTAARPGDESAAPAAIPVLVEAADSTVVFEGIPRMSGHSKMKRLTINKPVVWLEQRPDGSLAWPPFQSKLDSPAEQPSIKFQEVDITNATVTITGKDGWSALVMEGVNVTGAFEVQGGQLIGKGDLTAERVILGSKITITDFKSPVDCSHEVMKLTKMSGKIYGGTLTGKMDITPQPKSQPIALNFHAKGIDSGQFMEAMGLGSALKIGKVELGFDGQGELLEPLKIKGEADFVTSEFNSAGVPVVAKMQKTAKDLNLADVNFESLRGELEIDQGTVNFRSIESLPKDASRLTAHGTVDLEGNINLEGEITLEGGVVGSVQKFFKEAGFLSKDGSLVKRPFKVTGKTDDPNVEM